MFQALLAWAVDGFGLELGFGLIKLASFFLALGLFVLFLKRLRAPAIVYLLTLPALTLLLELRAAVRPELISYSLSIIAMMLYQRADGRISLRSMLPITALMLFWTNYHTSVLGYVLFFGLFIDAAVLQMRDKSAYGAWLHWLLWGLVVVIVGIFNRHFSHNHLWL